MCLYLAACLYLSMYLYLHLYIISSSGDSYIYIYISPINSVSLENPFDTTAESQGIT